MKKRPNQPSDPTNENSNANQIKAIEFISHYTMLLRTNRAPDLQTIIDNYDGPKAEIEQELRFAAFLEEAFHKAGEESKKHLKPDNFKKAKYLMLQMAGEIREKSGFK